MSSVPTDQQHDLQDKYADILKDGKFWKLAKHQNSVVSITFLLSEIVQDIKYTLSNNGIII